MVLTSMDHSADDYLSILQWLLADTSYLQGAAAAEVNAASLLTQQQQQVQQVQQVVVQRGATSTPMIAPPAAQAPPPPIPPAPPASTPLPPGPQQPSSATFMPLSNRQHMYGSMYGYQQAKMGPMGPVTPSPYQQAIHPDVRIKRLPFYDIVSELVKPSSLAGCLTNNPTGRGHESSFVFYLTPQQATEVAANREIGPGPKNEYSVQVQLRFCLLETSCEQEDVFPPSISVKVNGKPATLPNPIPTNRPGVEPKRPPRPVNISPLVKLCPSVANHIVVSWSPDYARAYVMVVHLVRKLSAQDLLTRLKTKGVRRSDFTTGLIKEKLCETDSDCEIATTSLRVSLLCPLGKMKMGVPARSTLCSHLQCFDASLYLQMNEKRPTWTCPVCDKQIPFDSIVIDGYFQEVLSSPNLLTDMHEIQLLKDGSWTCTAATKEESKPSAIVSSPKAEIEEILDDGDDDEADVSCNIEEKPVKEKKMIEIDLTGSDSEDEVSSITSTSTVAAQHTSAAGSLTSATTPATSTATLSAPQLQPHKRDLLVSDSSNSSGGGRSVESSIITLDSPSPPGSPLSLGGVSTQQQQQQQLQQPLLPGAAATSAAGSHHLLPYASAPVRNHIYPQIIQGAGQNINRPLVMQIRMPNPADHGRYHPY